MKPGEAQDIIDIIGGSVRSTNFGGHTFEVWMAKLQPLDVELATKAATKGCDQWEYFPSWAEFHEFYMVEIRERARQQGLAENAEVTRQTVAAPEWVYVWLWSRNARKPRQLRPFPQQEGWCEPDGMLSKDEYEELRGEWEQAGSPKLFRSAAAGLVQSAQGAAPSAT